MSARRAARPFEVLLAQFSRHGSAAVLPGPAAPECQFSAEDEDHVRARRPPQAAGAPDTVRQRISSLVATAMPDELMLATPVYDIGGRLRSLGLVLEHAARPRRGGERR
ncbi:MAG TPA: hypothetical protein VKV38_12900 [Trebonia sp.]|jgi:hypothetical protein|nr:hypothetical protein [Trebonia sp.]